MFSLLETEPGHPRNSLVAEQQKRDAARLPVRSNAALALLKLAAALGTGSVTVLAETVNSMADLIGSAVTYGTVRAAERAPDETHAYGHGKFENLSGVLVALLVIGSGVYALVEALGRFTHRDRVLQTGPAIAVMALSVVVNLLVSRQLLSVGRRYDSPALEAEGRHLQTDILSSGAALIGLILTHATGWYWVDPAVAVAITLVILVAGAQIAREAVITLSDAALPAAEEARLRAALDREPNVLGYHKLRTRKSGSERHVDVHVQIDDRLSFVQAHQITEELEDKLRAALPNLYPMIHAEPYEAETHHQREEAAEQRARDGQWQGRLEL